MKRLSTCIVEQCSVLGKAWGVLLFVLLALTMSASLRAAGCTPTSARICVEADDEADLYVNGVFVAHFAYVNWDSAGVVPCQTITDPTVLAALGAGGTLSTRVHNIGSGEMWAAYSIDVSCSGGQHSYVSSGSASGATGYHQSDCNTPPANPPGSGGTNWYDPAFVPSGWSAPVVVTGATWGKPVYDPKTGTILPQLSYSNTGSAADACQYYYMHQPFTLSPVTPPGPPAMTISKSANPTTNITSATRVTYTLHVCNTGGFTDKPVTITDNYNPGFRYDGPNGGNTPNGPNFTNTGSTLTISWPNGFPGGGACQDVAFWVTDDYQDPNTESCIVRANQASLAYNNNSSNQNVNSNTVNVTMLCIPTNTPTPTNTFTPTWTFTPTRSNTPTWTFTSTWTHTNTNTFTQSPTFTPTRTNTNTNTFTATFTNTVTRTNTPTNTNTNTYTQTPTNTPTRTNTNTNTYTQTNTPTNTATIPPTPTVPVNTFTRTITATSTQTATLTRTPTPTATFTATPTRTVTATPTDTITTLNTQTDTSTVTPTRTVTATDTSTPSPTATRTITVTSTQTITTLNTQTDTSTITQTRTPTATPSVTLTDTPSRTVTLTSTATITTLDTSTDTSTVTQTRTSTATPSVTPTDTPTRTVTSTPSITVTTQGTSTDTSTVTQTRTSTATPSVTLTDTPSRTVTQTSTATITTLDTSTDTSTVTQTRTSTATPSVTLTDTPSRTVTQTSTATITTLDTSTDTPSATLTVTATRTQTVTQTATPSITTLDTSTDTPSVTATRSSTATPSASPTETTPYSATDSPTATPSRTVTLTRTQTPTSTDTRTATVSVTQSYSSTVTPSFTFTVTATPTKPPLAMPYQLSVGAYNSAGELVRLIYQGLASAEPTELTLSGGNGQPVSLALPGPLADGSTSLFWKGENQAGQPISSGVYVIKLQTTDSFGQVDTLQKDVQMLATEQAAQLALYNSAGELVRHWDLKTLGFDAVDLGRVLDGSVELKDLQGAVMGLPMDGLNDAGQPLTGGVYNLVLRRGGPGSSASIIRSISIVPAAGADPLEGLAPEQNPLPAGQDLIALRYTPQAGVFVEGSLFNLAGERVAVADSAQAGRLVVALGRGASGVYLFVVEAKGAGLRPARRTVKIGVVR